MRVIEQYTNARTGERGQREVEMPDMLSDEQARAQDERLVRETRALEIRSEVAQLLVSQALGLAVADRLKALRDEFSAL
jgi:hypothetical protein